MEKQLKKYIAWQVTKFYSNTKSFECEVGCEELEKDHVFCIYTLQKFKAVKDDIDSVNYQHFKNLVEAYERAQSE